MTKKGRTILFLACLLLFFLAAPAIILYSQGYRIDFNPQENGKNLTQTGGIFLKTSPKSAEIYLNDELAKKTDFFFGTALIENLLPKKYKIEVKKEGYIPWEKILEINEREVAEAKNIILFPENPNFKVLLKGIENFWLSPDRKKIIIEEKNGNHWALKLYEPDKSVKSYLIEDKDISKTETELISLRFKNSQEAVLEVGIGEQLKYFSLDIAKIPPDLKATALPHSAGTALAYKQTNNDLYYLDGLGYLFKNKEKISQNAFPVKRETKYVLEVFGDYVFLQENNDLYQLNLDSGSFEKIADGIKGFKISPDSQKLAYFSNFEIWVLFLKEKIGQPAKKAGEKLFITRLSEKISDVAWISSNYLAFGSGNKIKIAEIDEREKFNVADFGEFENPDIFWNSTDKKLYVLSKRNLYSSDSLLP